MITPTAPSPPQKRFSRKWYNLRSIAVSLLLWPRIYLALAAALVILVLLPPSVAGSVRDACAWIGGGAIYLGLSFRTM